MTASYDHETVTVYQAYRPEIADYAVANQRFGGPWSFSRMSWIKPGFMWMMYRSGWASKPDQERVLAVHLVREAFDSILRTAVHSSYSERHGLSREEWEEQVATSEARLQWDPDHDPGGGKLERRAIQLGLRGKCLRKFAVNWIVQIEDITSFVQDQRQVLAEGVDRLHVPAERVYPLDHESATRLCVDRAD